MSESMGGEGQRSLAVTIPVREGIAGDFEAWLAQNLLPPDASAPPEGIAPFPPAELMHNTTGLTEPRDFASHGVHFMRALNALSPTALPNFRSVLDFGVGVGRVARLFHGFRGRYVGMDVDDRHIAWVDSNLTHVQAVKTRPRRRLPAIDRSFDAVISISVFSHLSEADHLFYLDELARVAAPGAVLFLSVHGEQALRRAQAEERVFAMLDIPADALDAAAETLHGGRGYAFIRQNGHLTSAAYDYGITFVSQDYVHSEWGRRFEVAAIGAGALHDFQDVVVLRAR
ncbi:class I SAM-dependent methyltransferase [Xanthobacter versatilis]|uniref:class I SAM-dependent methyltransferase n=1 Tax=Xanthobacter autotrophicus (strain ATCC BAA-1158 / Py2) TaxID=78245 RepID=UPI0037291A3C